MQPAYITFLKVKNKHISAEKNIIRHQELRWKRKAREAKARERDAERKQALDIVNELYWHRIGVVRPEARATNIAYAFLRKRDYVEVERNISHLNFARPGYTPFRSKQMLWDRVFSIVAKFSGITYNQAEREVKEWRAKHPKYEGLNIDDLAVWSTLDTK